jgi:hypothetical protein
MLQRARLDRAEVSSAKKRHREKADERRKQEADATIDGGHGRYPPLEGETPPPVGETPPLADDVLLSDWDELGAGATAVVPAVPAVPLPAAAVPAADAVG